ncbi:alpha-glucan family phosphorylase [Roseivirga pacifica]|uniref:alpha-glucan family phosphorylase n=1 Tax=Roseivirga pacifica TaxID=1267423 RepID=UPI002095C88D|nr:alpha-glucan family phosphorylase [Roseivirga pacifica]MCO6358368.1 alpha-glucan family phosphorylase [Roseivirga pacifica]MCO6366168.1 alpha-glucan family phosphorylase [Roseivirga pacifica]MCO6369281.1 alpha-glucan family phosphorylase [Roseivirga pacifica]MCO6374099.1 alpha-glucan family phosphorylase [Roseivirga pacifica]MCO6378475.1 alpha-glucan family phosphorylase [Roseivirga pacifica]
MKLKHPYKFGKGYEKPVAYFSMEFAIDQPLKIYSGGLGFLAGSHMRSAYDLKQNVIGIGILWKYGYYDQTRKHNNEMDALWQERHYNFLEDTGIVLEVTIDNHPVKVKVFYLPPEVFGTAPIFLLSTDHPENDHLAHTITHKLYDNNIATRIAQYVVLGIGGAKLLEVLGHEVDLYHFNEAHALPAAFRLLEKLGSLDELKQKLVFTTHTPVKAGNEVNDPNLLHKLGFFNGFTIKDIEDLVGFENGMFNHTLAALRMSKIANAVSKKHCEVSRDMWGGFEDVCDIIPITNAQNKAYWVDDEIEKAYQKKNDKKFLKRKLEMKKALFELVADQTGKIFDPNVLTIVWARRFAGYKRADLIARDAERFERLLNNKKYPVQIIWAGKPYPLDHGAVSTFNWLVHFTRKFHNATILTGYELGLSALMKKGSDVWLNNPRIPLEASGTSGMTAAMNGSLNFSTNDGWILEFGEHGKNGFVIPEVDISLPEGEQDQHDADHMMQILEDEIVPMYYDDKAAWTTMNYQSMEDVEKYFRAARMADEYYKKLYNL